MPYSMTWNEMPEPKQIPPGLETKILHANITIGGAQVMAADVPGFQPMRSAYLTLSVDTDEAAERVYKILSEGGEIYMAIQESFFATRFAMLRDKFGVSWMIMRSRPQ